MHACMQDCQGKLMTSNANEKCEAFRICICEESREQSQKQEKEENMADKKLVEAITAMEDDFAQWYTDVVKKAELLDYTSIKGCMVFKPAGYAIWELIQRQMDDRFKATGVENVYLPM